MPFPGLIAKRRNFATGPHHILRAYTGNWESNSFPVLVYGLLEGFQNSMEEEGLGNKEVLTDNSQILKSTQSLSTEKRIY